MLNCLFLITGFYCIYKDMEIVLFLFSLSFFFSNHLLWWSEKHPVSHWWIIVSSICTRKLPLGDVPLQEQQPVSSALESPLHHSPFPIRFSFAVQKKGSVLSTQSLDKSVIMLLQCCRFCTGVKNNCSRALHQAPSCLACTPALNPTQLPNKSQIN